MKFCEDEFCKAQLATNFAIFEGFCTSEVHFSIDRRLFSSSTYVSKYLVERLYHVVTILLLRENVKDIVIDILQYLNVSIFVLQ